MSIKSVLRESASDIIKKVMNIEKYAPLTQRMQALLAIELKIRLNVDEFEGRDNRIVEFRAEENQFIDQIKEILQSDDYPTNNSLIKKTKEIINNFSELKSKLKNNIKKLISYDILKSEERRFSDQKRTIDNKNSKIIKKKEEDGYFIISQITEGARRRPSIALKKILKPTNSKNKHYDFWLIKNCDIGCDTSDPRRGLYISELNRYVFPEDYTKIRDGNKRNSIIKELPNFDSFDFSYPKKEIFLESIWRGFIMGISDRRDDNLSSDMRHIDLDSNEMIYQSSIESFNLFKNNEMTSEFLQNNITDLKKLLKYYMAESLYNNRLIKRFYDIEDEEFIKMSDKFFNKLRDRLKTEDNLKKVNEILEEKTNLLNFEKGFSFLGAEFAFESKKSIRSISIS